MVQWGGAVAHGTAWSHLNSMASSYILLQRMLPGDVSSLDALAALKRVRLAWRCVCGGGGGASGGGGKGF